ncbi:hypothetical protein ABS735_22340 [Streptomyces sp. MMCC 100]|uniref:hypothetical protein n=1 Tax=Streptomyces sp. MMCC 100 TaxID=3163555 RepID=UPI00359AD9D6
MNHLFPLVRRLLLFASIAGLASLVLPQIGVVATRNSAYESALTDNWDAAAAAAGLTMFGALEIWWASWLWLSVAGGMVDNNLGKGLASALTGGALICVAGVVLVTSVFP